MEKRANQLEDFERKHCKEKFCSDTETFLEKTYRDDIHILEKKIVSWKIPPCEIHLTIINNLFCVGIHFQEVSPPQELFHEPRVMQKSTRVLAYHLLIM